MTAASQTDTWFHNLRGTVQSTARMVIDRWGWVIALFVVMRVLYSLIAIIAIWNNALGYVNPSGYAYDVSSKVIPNWGVISTYLINPWYRWDTGWYTVIAYEGYVPGTSSLAFAPLYPLLIRLLGPLVGNNLLLASLIISNVSALVFFILFYELGRDIIGDESTVRRALLYLVSFPTAFFLMAGYTESLFLALTLGAWLLVRRERWWWAGLLSGLLVLARFQGAALALPLGWMILEGANPHAASALADARTMLDRVRLRDHWRGLWQRLKAGAWFPVLAPVVVFLLYRQVWLPISGWGSQSEAFTQTWGIRFVMPWQGFILDIQKLLAEPIDIVSGLHLAFAIFAFAVAIAGLRRLNMPLSLYTWSTLAVIFTRDAPRAVWSFTRYSVALFPNFFVLARWGRNRWVHRILLVVFLMLQVLFITLFVRWYFVG